ncbi:MAG: hypothetical protein IAE83_22290 [Anaerolinea sp.]|nr:hypothetical protein [Anaerolinea sp.]CAG0961372.1 hypothetical protein ANRL4_00689 [Anaerolineae bacterium]
MQPVRDLLPDDAARVDPTRDRSQIIAALESCLSHYADDLTLAQSLLASWQVVRQQVSLIPPPSTEQLGRALRHVLDEIIDALKQSAGNQDTAAQRRFVIADRLYRQGEKPGEIYHNHLTISKAQFYRERTETLSALADRLLQMEQRALEQQRAETVKKLAMLPPATTSRLFGVDWLLRKVLDALLSPNAPGLIILDGLGGLGKTALARVAAERAWITGRFGALAWINAQTRMWQWSRPQPVQESSLSLNRLYDLLLRQLNQSLLTFDQIFSTLAREVGSEEVPDFDQLLDVLSREIDERELPTESVRAKFISILELLWAAPTLIILDGLEAVSDLQLTLESLWEAVSRSQAKVIVTSRRRLGEFQNAYTLHMNELDNANAVLLARHYALERGIGSVGKASDEDINRIVEAAGANPLAMRLLVDQLSTLPFSQVYHDFCNPGVLSSDLYKHIYGDVWQALSQEAKTALWALANFPAHKTDLITWERLRGRVSMPPEILNSALKELASSCLVHVTENLSPNYWISTLTRRFVLSQVAPS